MSISDEELHALERIARTDGLSPYSSQKLLAELRFLRKTARPGLEELLAAERERCAFAAETFTMGTPEEIAAAIRALP